MAKVRFIKKFLLSKIKLSLLGLMIIQQMNQIDHLLQKVMIINQQRRKKL
jgi:hypothetical protein